MNKMKQTKIADGAPKKLTIGDLKNVIGGVGSNAVHIETKDGTKIVID